MEEKKANEMEMAAQENEEREKAEEAAQGWVKINIFLDYLNPRKLYKQFILSFF